MKKGTAARSATCGGTVPLPGSRPGEKRRQIDHSPPTSGFDRPTAWVIAVHRALDSTMAPLRPAWSRARSAGLFRLGLGPGACVLRPFLDRLLPRHIESLSYG